THSDDGNSNTVPLARSNTATIFPSQEKNKKENHALDEQPLSSRCAIGAYGAKMSIDRHHPLIFRLFRVRIVQHEHFSPEKRTDAALFHHSSGFSHPKLKCGLVFMA
ncbi:MAG: hypothetical protein AAFZ74_14510, partial [Pseudomonadota bacterium]